MRISLPIKLMASYLLVAGLIVLPSIWFLRQSLDRSLEQAEDRDLRRHVEALRDHLARVPEEDIHRVVRESARLLSLRVTLVHPGGVVIDDSELSPDRIAALENHHDRPEVLAALSGSVGYAHRKSSTLGAELLYAAAPLPATGPPRLVVRVASSASVLHRSVQDAFLALRLAAGGGVSAAIILSLIAAFSVSTPLRRMRDAARSFAQAKWVTVKRVRSWDELDELSEALDELGRKLRQQLIELGGQETLVLQAVQAIPLPALLLQSDLQPLLLNGAFRAFAGITGVNEGAKLSELTQSAAFSAARKAAEKAGLPMELALPAPVGAPTAAVLGTLSPLSRADSPPLWLVVIDVKGPESEARGPEAVQLHLRGAEVILEKLWEQQPDVRPQLAQVHRRLDEAAHAAGHPEATSVEPVEAADLCARCVEEMHLLHPGSEDRLSLTAKASCKIAESTGLAARAVRLFLDGALRALPRGKMLELTLDVEPTVVKLLLEGAAPPDLSAIAELTRALGTDVKRVAHREREAAWLSLPRA